MVRGQSDYSRLGGHLTNLGRGNYLIDAEQAERLAYAAKVVKAVKTVSKHGPAFVTTAKRAAKQYSEKVKASKGLRGGYTKKGVKKGGIPKAVAEAVMSVVPGYTRQAGLYGRFGHELGKMTELKFFDTAISFSSAETAVVPATGQLSLIPQGTEADERIGRKVKIHSLFFRGTLKYDPSTNTTPADLFMYIVLDKQANGAAAATLDVMTGNNLGISMINMANSKRFRILKRFVVTAPPLSGTGTALTETLAHFEWYHKCNIPIEYSSTTGALSEIKSNNIFILAGSSTKSVIVLGTCRMRFSD